MSSVRRRTACATKRPNRRSKPRSKRRVPPWRARAATLPRDPTSRSRRDQNHRPHGQARHHPQECRRPPQVPLDEARERCCRRYRSQPLRNSFQRTNSPGTLACAGAFRRVCIHLVPAQSCATSTRRLAAASSPGTGETLRWVAWRHALHRHVAREYPRRRPNQLVPAIVGRLLAVGRQPVGLSGQRGHELCAENLFHVLRNRRAPRPQLALGGELAQHQQTHVSLQHD